MASDDPLAIAAAAALGFAVLQCAECADSIRRALQAAGQHGELIEIRGNQGRNFIVCLSYDGGAATITLNGRHFAVRVGTVVFDNLHPTGMPIDAWWQDFDAIGGVVLHAGTPF